MRYLPAILILLVGMSLFAGCKKEPKEFNLYQEWRVDSHTIQGNDAPAKESRVGYRYTFADGSCTIVTSGGASSTTSFRYDATARQMTFGQFDQYEVYATEPEVLRIGLVRGGVDAGTLTMSPTNPDGKK